MSEDKQWPIDISGLWVNKTKDGKTYMKGVQGQTAWLIFKNTNKEEGSNQPDYLLKVAKHQKPKEESAESTEGDFL